jgi:hypothetical protein
LYSVCNKKEALYTFFQESPEKKKKVSILNDFNQKLEPIPTIMSDVK